MIGFGICSVAHDAVGIIDALIAAATRAAAAHAVPAPKKLTFSRVKVLFFFYLFPMAIDEPPFDFITNVGRFLFLNHAELHARFISHHSCFFFHDPVSVFYARGPQTMPSWPLN